MGSVLKRFKVTREFLNTELTEEWERYLNKKAPEGYKLSTVVKPYAEIYNSSVFFIWEKE